MKIIYLLVAVLVLVSCEKFTLYKHENSAARCLDGSPAGLYFAPGQQSDKFVIYFEGGGLCRGDGLAETLEYCYKRSKTNLGSSLNYSAERSFDGMTYISAIARNPFHDWNRVFIPYCDGGVHQGSRLDPIKYKDS
jgi:O-palmitoleoyl-L-serine hydrolase